MDVAALIVLAVLILARVAGAFTYNGSEDEARMARLGNRVKR